jgi:aminoglycoside phosphotransferase (APT) family kinase protein
MITAHGPIIIDWMTATRGNPLADVARTLLLLTISKPQTIIEQLIIRFARRIFVSGYLKRYCELRPYDDDQLAAWQPIIAAARINENIAGERERLLAVAGGGAKLKKTN